MCKCVLCVILNGMCFHTTKTNKVVLKDARYKYTHAIANTDLHGDRR